MRDMIPITVIADEEQLFSDKLSVLSTPVDTMHRQVTMSIKLRSNCIELPMLLMHVLENQLSK